MSAHQTIALPPYLSGHKTGYLVSHRDPLSAVPPVVFTNSRISAETYIEHMGLPQSLKINEIAMYGEFADAINHRLELERQMARAKLTPRDREVLGIK